MQPSTLLCYSYSYFIFCSKFWEGFSYMMCWGNWYIVPTAVNKGLIKPFNFGLCLKKCSYFGSLFKGPKIKCSLVVLWELDGRCTPSETLPGVFDTTTLSWGFWHHGHSFCRLNLHSTLCMDECKQSMTSLLPLPNLILNIMSCSSSSALLWAVITLSCILWNRRK